MEISLRSTLAAGGPGGRLASSGTPAVPVQEIASITVSRRSPEDAGVREIFVSVDGEEIAILSNGETTTHEVTAGPHRLRAHNTLFWKTHEIVLTAGEHARFTVVNRAPWSIFGFLIVLGAAPLGLSFERDP